MADISKINVNNTDYTILDSNAARSSHNHTINSIIWPASHNLTCTPTSDNSEFSIDIQNADYSGKNSYWHVWSQTKETILACYADTGLVSINNNLNVIGLIFEGGTTLSQKYAAANHNHSIYTANYHWGAPHEVTLKWADITIPQGGYNIGLKIFCGQGYNADVVQDRDLTLMLRTSNYSSNNNGFYISGYVDVGRFGNLANFYIEKHSATSYTLWSDAVSYPALIDYIVTHHEDVKYTPLHTTGSLPTDNLMMLPVYNKVYQGTSFITGSGIELY